MVGLQMHLVLVGIGFFKQAETEFLGQNPRHDFIDFFFAYLAAFDRLRQMPYAMATF